MRVEFCLIPYFGKPLLRGGFEVSQGPTIGTAQWNNLQICSALHGEESSVTRKRLYIKGKNATDKRALLVDRAETSSFVQKAAGQVQSLKCQPGIGVPTLGQELAV